MQFFNLPLFCINKMKECMIDKKEKELQRIAEMEADGKPTYKYHASLLIV